MAEAVTDSVVKKLAKKAGCARKSMGTTNYCQDALRNCAAVEV